MKKDPFYKIRYASGLGDIIRCILHSRLVGPITKFITKQDKPCLQCQHRAQALNVLFPISFWRVFFKSKKELEENLIKEARDYGYEVRGCEQLQKEEDALKIEKTKEEEIEPIINNYSNPIQNYQREGHVLTNQTETSYNDLKVVILFYKKIDK